MFRDCSREYVRTMLVVRSQKVVESGYGNEIVVILLIS